ncbi:hypothetical protein JCGZ_15536 [Jatropha curcas]|uniref:Uncharacterized protein n=1 Tax=Jatropha curcas TaxID=180498 RepID=A0A067KES9_JATCU|nr:hypothetical protein JCGZ_15536 [Jatropha curcas]
MSSGRGRGSIGEGSNIPQIPLTNEASTDPVIQPTEASTDPPPPLEPHRSHGKGRVRGVTLSDAHLSDDGRLSVRLISER